MANKLPTPSEEQNYIIEGFKTGCNIKIVACAGASKSTSLLMLSRVCKTQNKKAIIVTYNKALQFETERRIKANRLGGVVVSYTVHGLAGKVYGSVMRNDEALVEALKDKTPKNIFEHVGVLMIDECQDLVREYYQFLLLLIPKKQIVIVGDPRQCIYEFKNASPKYLLDAEKYFNNGGAWSSYNLSTSYRLPPKLGQFIEQHVLRNQSKFVGGYDDNNPTPLHYYKSRTYMDPEFKMLVLGRILHYGPSNCIIIIPSFGGGKPNPNSPLGKLLDYLTENIKHLQIAFRSNKHVSSSETEANKLLVSTIHGCKGGTWDLSIVFYATEKYMKYYDQEWPTRDKCKDIPNPLYVALTRAHEMIVFEDADAQPMRTVDIASLGQVAKVSGVPLKMLSQSITADEILSRYVESKNISVLDIINFRNVDDTIALMKLIKCSSDELYDEELPDMDAPALTHTFEIEGKSISDFVFKYYGICIPILAEYRHSGSYEKLHEIHKMFIVKVFVHRYAFSCGEARTLLDKLNYLLDKFPDKLQTKYGNKSYFILRNILNAPYEDVLHLYNHIPPMPISEAPYEADMYKLVRDANPSLTSIMKQIIYFEEFDYKYVHYSVSHIDEWLDKNFIEIGVSRLCKFLQGEVGTWEYHVDYTARHPKLYELMKDAEPIVVDNKVVFQKTKPLIVTDDCYKYSYHKINILGSIDFYTSLPMEFKVTLKDEDAHLLQIATYMALLNTNVGTLYNVLTNTVKTVELENIPEFLKVLCRHIPNWE